MLSQPIADVRYALRGFARRPTFAAVVVLTLAAGIGLNVSVFSVYDQLILRRLPVSNPTELVNFVGAGPQPGNRACGVQGACDELFSYPMFRDLEAADGPFTGIAASRLVPTNLGYRGRTAPGQVALVSGKYFSVLGLGPSLGRLLGPQDTAVAGEAGTAVLSYDYWTNALGADPGVLGTTLVANGKHLEIVGVTPPGFQGTTVGDRALVFVPITIDWFDQPRLTDRFSYWTYVFGRLKPGVTINEAQAAINVPYHAALNEIEAPMVRGLEGKDLERFRSKSIELRPGAHGQSVRPITARTPLAIFFGAAATIFLIACVNLANLMFARGAARIGEMAVRLSMGAARHRLFALLGIEAFLLAAGAAIVSIPIALAVLRAVAALLPPYTVNALDLTLNLRAVAVAFAVAALSTTVFALVPMLKLAATDPASTLQANGAGRAFGGKGLGRFRFVLSTAQIGLSMLLLALAGLFTHSLANIARVDLGLRTDSLVTFTVEPSGNGYSAERSRQLFDRIEQELAAQPGVTDVTSSMISLLDGEAWGRGVSVEGRPPEGMPGDHAYVNYVGTHFLSTFGIPLLAGREFTEADSEGRPLVAMVNEAFAERFGLGRYPIGRRVATRGGGAPNLEIVGLFRDTAYNMVKLPSAPQVVTPRRQELDTSQMSFYARTAQSPDALLAAIPRIVANVDPDLPATNVRTFASQIRKNVRADWLLTTVAGSLAAIATLLAALGLYGVLSYTVAQRTREIGVRLALGAAPERVRAMVLKQVARMVAIGVPLGLVGALLIGGLAAALLYGLAPTDPVAFVAASLLLTAVVLGASYIPARRASRVDPVVALRSE